MIHLHFSYYKQIFYISFQLSIYILIPITIFIYNIAMN